MKWKVRVNLCHRWDPPSVPKRNSQQLCTAALAAEGLCGYTWLSPSFNVLPPRFYWTEDNVKNLEILFYVRARERSHWKYTITVNTYFKFFNKLPCSPVRAEPAFFGNHPELLDSVNIEEWTFILASYTRVILWERIGKTDTGFDGKTFGFPHKRLQLRFLLRGGRVGGRDRRWQKIHKGK